MLPRASFATDFNQQQQYQNLTSLLKYGSRVSILNTSLMVCCLETLYKKSSSDMILIFFTFDLPPRKGFKHPTITGFAAIFKSGVRVYSPSRRDFKSPSHIGLVAKLFKARK
jgi:hypothetical protein